MRRSLAVLVALGLVLAAGGAAQAPARISGPAVPGRCCFMVSVDADGSYHDVYRGTAPSQWRGSADGTWSWSTRLLARYTGSGVVVVGDSAMAQAASESGSDYDVIFLDPLPPKHKSCPSKVEEAQWGSDQLTRTAARGRFVHAVRNVSGYARALVVTPAGRLSFACNFLGESLVDEAFAAKAPSADNFLGGRSFQRSCWKQVTTSLTNPFPHTVTVQVSLGIRFIYFRQDDLSQKEKLLGALEGRDSGVNPALRRANLDYRKRKNPDRDGDQCF
jgi:hypothetical protein